MEKRILAFDEIIRIVKPLAEKYHIKEVYIFGSYARGEADHNSDVDVLAVGGDHFRHLIFSRLEKNCILHLIKQLTLMKFVK